jgi:hypothetical protein
VDAHEGDIGDKASRLCYANAEVVSSPAQAEGSVSLGRFQNCNLLETGTSANMV